MKVIIKDYDTIQIKTLSLENIYIKDDRITFYLGTKCFMYKIDKERSLNFSKMLMEMDYYKLEDNFLLLYVEAIKDTTMTVTRTDTVNFNEFIQMEK